MITVAISCRFCDRVVARMAYLIIYIIFIDNTQVTPRKKFKCADCSPVGSLWSDPNHFLERHECLKVFTNIYGNMPLKSVQFRADPVLFKDEFPTVPKKFSDMGNL